MSMGSGITQPDLFGGESLVPESLHGTYAKSRVLMGYRPATEKGQNCGTCRHSFQTEGNTKHYRKCDLIGESASMSTDVSRTKVCNKWEGSK